MHLFTTDFVSGKEIETLGLVRGITIQTKSFGKDFVAGLKSFVGGEMKPYTDMVDEAVREATLRMIEEAKKLNADAIINVRYESEQFRIELAPGSKVLVYGTAVKFV